MFKAYFSQILIVSLREKCCVFFFLEILWIKYLDFAPMAHDVKWGIEKKNLSFCYQQRIFWMNIDVNIWIQSPNQPKGKGWNNYLEEATGGINRRGDASDLGVAFFKLLVVMLFCFLNVGDTDSGMISTFLATFTVS